MVSWLAALEINPKDAATHNNLAWMTFAFALVFGYRI